MKKIKANGDKFPMAHRGYRLGFIRAKRILETEPMLEEYDDYMDLFVWVAKDWWKDTEEYFGCVQTDKKGHVVAVDI